jgi:DNA-binding response OmpR family regulator
MRTNTLRSIPPAAARAPRPRVLVVDDRPTPGAVMGRMLEDAGFAVQVVRDAATALRAFQADTPDLVLCEALLPDESGVDLCKRLRRQENGRRAGVVMITPAVDATLHRRALAAGADDFFQEPVSHEELVSRLRSHLASKRLDALLERVDEGEDEPPPSGER